MRLHQPDIAEIMEDASLSFYSLIEQMVIDELFPKCKSISVDYAIMEKAKDMYVFPADFGWSDLGTWGSLHERTEKDASNNAAIGPNIHLIESTNCMVHTPENKKHPLNLQTHRRTTHQRVSVSEKTLSLYQNSYR